jgi:hypothetical protein
LFAYAAAAIEILALLIWLLPYRRPDGVGRVFGSLMMAGALFSFTLGFILLPFALMGLIFLIGFLGFVPFLTGLVYLRNGARALKRGGWDIDSGNLVLAFVVGSIFAIGGPMMLQWRIWELTPCWITNIKNDSHGADIAKFNLKAFGYLTSYPRNQLIQTYNESSDYEQRERLSNAYKEITGKNIEDEVRLRERF